MMIKRILTPAMVPVVAVLLLAAACGDDSGSSSTTEAPIVPEDILEDLADGSLDEGDLEGLVDSAEDLVEGFGGSGSGTVEIKDDTIDFTSEVCFAAQGDLTIEGSGATEDGTPVWVSISRTEDTRAELSEFLDEELIQQLYGDADPIIDMQVTVDYGRDEMFAGTPDDMPSFDAGTTGLAAASLSIDVDGDQVSGSGEAVDTNAVVGDFDDVFPFTFQAGCD